MRIDDLTAHAACEAKDRRFDGLFFVGVTSTGVYCRCVCPARTPKPQNRTFHPSAAAAERAGFRPCLICRPERAPGHAPIDQAGRLAHDALRRIEAGALEEQGLESLAGELGVTGRHLRRVMIETFGAAPVQLAQTHRLLTAKRLLSESHLGMTAVAMASGFGSVRRFNALFQERYGMAPSRVRARAGKAQAAALTVRLDARGAFDACAAYEDVARKGAARLEAAAGSLTWVRTYECAGRAGWLSLAFTQSGVAVTISDTLAPAFRQIVAAVRGWFDLDVDVSSIDAFFAERALNEAWGARLPGGIDAFETTVRAIVGQQVTLAAARTITARIVERFGAPIETPFPGLDRLFPSPGRLAEARADEISVLGMPRRRGETIRAAAVAAAEGRLKLSRGAVAAGRRGLLEIPGVGPWTLEYVALRGLGDPDAFPAGDAALKAALGGADSAKAADAWRPWRGYAAARLWRRVMNEGHAP